MLSVAKSLVLPVDVAGLPRYRLLDTIRHYGQQKLVAAGELSGALDRHLEHYRAFSGELADAFLTDRQAWCVATAWVEQGNLYAAMEHALASGDGVAALETGRGVWGALNALIPAIEERQRVRRILDATTDCGAELRHPGLVHSGFLAFNAGDLRAFLAIVAELKAVRDVLDDPMSLATTATVEASALAFSSLDDAREVIAGARELSRDTPAFAPAVAYMAGLIEAHFGDLDRAQTVLDEVAASCRRLGQTALGALALSVGARTALCRGDLARARRMAEASLECSDEFGPLDSFP